MKTQNAQSLRKAFFFVSFLVLLTQAGFAPFPQEPIPPIDWNTEMTDGAQWEAIQPDSNFNPNKFCDYDSSAPFNQHLRDNKNCYGDQFYGLKEFVSPDGEIVQVLLLNGKRYLLQQSEGKWYFSCFNGTVGSATYSTSNEAYEISSSEAANIKKTIEEYQDAQEEYRKEAVDFSASMSGTLTGTGVVCLVGGLVGIGSIVFTGGLSTPLTMSILGTCASTGVLSSIVTNTAEGFLKVKAADAKAEKYTDQLKKYQVACPVPGEF